MDPNDRSLFVALAVAIAGLVLVLGHLFGLGIGLNIEQFAQDRTLLAGLAALLAILGGAYLIARGIR